MGQVQEFSGVKCKEKSVLGRGNSTCKGPGQLGTASSRNQKRPRGWIADGCGTVVPGELERPAGVGQAGLCALVEPKRTQELLRGVRAGAGLFWKSPHIPSAKPWVLPNM